MATGKKLNQDPLLEFGSYAVENIPQGLTYKSHEALAVKLGIVHHQELDSISWNVHVKGGKLFNTQPIARTSGVIADRGPSIKSRNPAKAQ